MSYTDEQRQYVTELWTSGQSASDIAALFNQRFDTEISRSAVCGLAHRMKLPAKHAGAVWATRGTAKRLATMTANGVSPGRKPQTLVLTVPEPSEAIGVFGEFAGCRWPVNSDGEEFRCCGHPQKPGRPYCPSHCHIAYAPKLRRCRALAAQTDNFDEH